MAGVWRRFWVRLGGAIVPRVLYPLTSWPVRRRLSEENFAHNRAHDVSGALIRSQRDDAVARLRYGHALCGKTGCGAVAVYNALTLLGRSPSLAEVIRSLERRRGPACGGHMGTHPFTLAGALRGWGVGARRVRRLSALESAVPEGGVAILAIWNSRDSLLRGAHFFTVQKTPAGFAACNRETGPDTGRTLAEIVGQGRFITGYLVFPLA